MKICRKGMERNQLAAARELLDRGYGRPLQMIDASIMSKKLTELSPDEIDALEARLLSDAAADAEAAQDWRRAGGFLPRYWRRNAQLSALLHIVRQHRAGQEALAAAKRRPKNSAALIRRSLVDWCRYTGHEPAAHHRLLIDWLESSPAARPSGSQSSCRRGRPSRGTVASCSRPG